MEIGVWNSLKLSDGFLLKRESGAAAGSASQKDLYIQLLDFDYVAQAVKESLLTNPSVTEHQPDLAEVAESQEKYSVSFIKHSQDKQNSDVNIYRFVNQLEIESAHLRAFHLMDRVKNVFPMVFYILMICRLSYLNSRVTFENKLP